MTTVHKVRKRSAAGAVRTVVTCAAAVLFAALSGFSGPPEARGADADAGLTGVSHPDDVIMARQLLMDGIESEMMPIDLAVGGKDIRLSELQAHAYAINTLLTAFPHLFPPETKPLASADGSTNGTAATAALWDNFDDFYDQAQSAASAAFDASQASDIGKFRESGARLRSGCDSCHAQYMHVTDPAPPR